MIFILKNLTIKGAFINPYAMKNALALMSNQTIDVEPLITHEFKLTDVADVLSGHYQAKITKAIIKI